MKCSECSLTGHPSYFSSELQKVLCQSSSIIAVFVCLNVDVVMVAMAHARFLSWTNKLCLFYSSWLRESFSVCPIEISHLFKISDSKQVLLCISVSTLTGTWFHVFS